MAPGPWDQLQKTVGLLQSTVVATAAARQLLPPGVDVDSSGWTALHCAAAAGIKPLVEQLLDAGIAVDCRGYADLTPLLCAAVHGCVAVMEQLIDQGADVNAKGSSWRCPTPLHWAAALGKIAATELLLTRGAAIHAVNNEGDTPLHGAAFNGHPAIIELLLAMGANVDAMNNKNNTPLHDAAYSGHVPAVQLLLARSAAVDAVNEEGNTPLHGAAVVYTPDTDHVAVAELLLEHGAAIDAVNERGRTPLHRAASNGRTDLVELLLFKCAAVHAKDHNGNTPLSCAVECAEDGDGNDMKLDVFNVILQAGHPWPMADLVDAARVAVWRSSFEKLLDVQPNWTAFAVLAKAIFLADRIAFDELLEELDLQGEDSAVMADDVRAIIKEWCSDVASLDQQRAELLEQRRDVEAQRRAVQHMIVNGACFLKHVVESTGSAHHGLQQQPDGGLLLPLGPMALACRP